MPVRRLDPVLIDRIAAGEVVERPASAIKELVENSLDAGARRISVRIEQAGRSLIRVADDGAGMGAADLALAVERHATSKLPTGDLASIATLGFRGEALPSIGSVARLDIVSREAESATAHAISVDAGRVSAVRPAARGPGTTVEVRDLFAATPARLKFLKADRAEVTAVADALRRLAMAHPAVHVSLDGTPTVGFDYLPCGDGDEGRLTRISQIVGDAFVDNALAIRAERPGRDAGEAIRLSGFVGLPTFHRGTRDGQYLFVNGRPVRDKLLTAALYAGYMDHVPRDRFPVVALFLDCGPGSVDVNVHPAKAEVRFRNSNEVRGLVVSTLRDALAGALHRASTTGGTRTLDAFAARSFGAAAPARPVGGWDARRSPSSPLNGIAPRGFGEVSQASFAAEPSADARIVEEAGDNEDAPHGAARAQMHETYIFAQTRDGIVIVDQHAAHERLVYERMKRSRAEGGIGRQMMLIPTVVEMAPDIAALLLGEAESLALLGLVVEPFGPGAVAVTEIPAVIGQGDMARARARSRRRDRGRRRHGAARATARPLSRDHGLPRLGPRRAPPRPRRDERLAPRKWSARRALANATMAGRPMSSSSSATFERLFGRR